MQYYYRPSFGFGRPWTPIVKKLIIANGIIFLFQIFDTRGLLVYFFGLDTGLLFTHFKIWQPVTYMFLHGGPFHLLFNMFALWMFGSEMEDFFGKREFLFYYFLTGIGAGFCVWLIDILFGGYSLTIGASGAIFGLLLAYGIVYARRQITLLLFFVMPITLQARTFVIAFAVMELVWGISGASQVAHFAHLGGMLIGYVYFKFLRKSLRPYFFGRSLLGDIGKKWPINRDRSDRERLDQILDKINRYGIHTLTDSEREFLDKMSGRRYH